MIIRRGLGIGLDPLDLLGVNDPSKAQAGLTSNLLRRGLIPTSLLDTPGQLPAAPKKVAEQKDQTPEPPKVARKA